VQPSAATKSLRMFSFIFPPIEKENALIDRNDWLMQQQAEYITRAKTISVKTKTPGNETGCQK